MINSPSKSITVPNHFTFIFLQLWQEIRKRWRFVVKNTKLFFAKLFFSSFSSLSHLFPVPIYVGTNFDSILLHFHLPFTVRVRESIYSAPFFYSYFLFFISPISAFSKGQRQFFFRFEISLERRRGKGGTNKPKNGCGIEGKMRNFD